MKEHPLLLQGWGVRATMEGRKTMTRRVMKPQPISLPDGAYCDYYRASGVEPYSHFTFWTHDNRMCNGQRGNIKIKGQYSCHWKCPQGVPGDRIWIREGWAQDLHGEIFYKADHEQKSSTVEKWKPSIHMPRRVCRLILEIVNIKVERVKDIGYCDALAEGIWDGPVEGHKLSVHQVKSRFYAIWDSINKKRDYGYQANPWTWVIEYKAIEP